MDHYEENIKQFGEAQAFSSINLTLDALRRLTPVEFRMWLDATGTYPGIHPSHFDGLEKQYIETGKWDWAPTEPH